MSSIKLSPKHGVNPTIPVCFFCGNEKNEIALMGKIGGRGEDIQAPHYAILDYEPCDACKENMAKGITMIGVVAQPLADGRPPFTKAGDTELYPTGAWVVVSEEFINRNINDPELAKSIIERRTTVADDIIVRDICKQIAEMQGTEE